MAQPSRAVRTAVIGTGLAYAVALHLAGLHLDAPTKKALAYLPTLAGFVVVAFDLWLWKIKGIHRFVGRPRIDGTWYCLLTPNPDSHIPEGGNWGPIPSAVVIEQTYWAVAVTTMTVESRSVSTSTHVRRIPDTKQHVLAYTYANEPGQQSRPRSQPHVGASELVIVGRDPREVNGTYWTARFTAGDLHLRFLNRRTDYPNTAAVLRDVPDSMRAVSAS